MKTRNERGRWQRTRGRGITSNVYTMAEALAVLPEVIYFLESFDCALVRSAIPNCFLAWLVWPAST